MTANDFYSPSGNPFRYTHCPDDTKNNSPGLLYILYSGLICSIIATVCVAFMDAPILAIRYWLYGISGIQKDLQIVGLSLVMAAVVWFLIGTVDEASNSNKELNKTEQLVCTFQIKPLTK